MSRSKFNDEFKRDAVAQITERGYPVREVSQRLRGQPVFALRLEEEVHEELFGRGGEERRDPAPEEGTGAGFGGAQYLKKCDRVFRQGCKVR